MGSLKTMIKMLDFILDRIRLIGGLNANVWHDLVKRELGLKYGEWVE